MIPSLGNGNGDEGAVRIYDRQGLQFMEILKLVLLETAEETHLPELYDIFGEKLLLKFLDLFAGMTIEVPTKRRLEYAIRDIGIYLDIKRSHAGQRSILIRSLARKHGLEMERVRSIYYVMEARMKRYAISI